MLSIKETKKDVLKVAEDLLIHDIKKADPKYEWIEFTEFAERMVDKKEAPIVLIVSTDKFLKTNKEALALDYKDPRYYWISLIILSDEQKTFKDFLPIPQSIIKSILPSKTKPSFIVHAVDRVIEMQLLSLENLKLQKELSVKNDSLKGMSKIGKLLGMEKDFSKLIRMVLMETIRIVSADAGSIYVVERTKNDQTPTHLRFKSTSLEIETIEEFLLPIDKKSIAGYVALTGKPLLIDDVYQISKNEEYSFNNSFDQEASYKTHSMMVIPMKDHVERVIGVIQMINRFKTKYKDGKFIKKEIVPFSNEDFELANAMAGQAGLTIKNNFLLQDIQNLFEGFVTASVTAIEQRDPTTSGHSFRVAGFTVGLAEAIDRIPHKTFRHVHFNKDQIQEIRYAALLHDFGKVGIKEEVLLKKKKLYPYELDIIKWRYYLFRETVNTKYLKDKINILKNRKHSKPDKLYKLRQKRDQELKKLEVMLQNILDLNNPTVLEDPSFPILQDMKQYMIQLNTGEKIPFLKDNEFLSLSVRKGSLNAEERKEIELHVSHTFNFLKKIPWTQDLSFIPDIAHGHHEKLDGSGYPLGIAAKDICLQTRMMTIADVYDALTAPDRPYKASLPKEKAIEILILEANENRIDRDLLNVFIDAKIFDQCEYKYA